MIGRTLDDIEGRYVFVPPAEGVSLATLGVLPYSPVDDGVREDSRVPRITVHPGAYEYPDPIASADGFGLDMTPFAVMPSAESRLDASGAGISFADMVRTIGPEADPGVWREDNNVPFWRADNSRALSVPSFNDLVRFINQTTNNQTTNPDVWRGEDGMPVRAGWEDPARYGALSDPMRAAAPGAFRIPDLPDDAGQWGLREPAPIGADRIPPVQLANWKGLAALWLIWSRLRGGRLPTNSRAPAPSGRKGEPLRTPPGPPRNAPGEVNNRPYSGHAFDKMQDQRLPPSVIENTVRRGAPRPGNQPGTTRYYDQNNNVSVVVDNKTGRVITNHYGDR